MLLVLSSYSEEYLRAPDRLGVPPNLMTVVKDKLAAAVAATSPHLAAPDGETWVRPGWEQGAGCRVFVQGLRSGFAFSDVHQSCVKYIMFCVVLALGHDVQSAPSSWPSTLGVPGCP